MKIIFGDAYTKEERRGFVKIIHQNILKSIQSLIETREKCYLQFNNLENIQNARYIKYLDKNEYSLFNSLHAQITQDLWEDAAIQTVYKSHLECNLLDSSG